MKLIDFPIRKKTKQYLLDKISYFKKDIDNIELMKKLNGNCKKFTFSNKQFELTIVHNYLTIEQNKLYFICSFDSYGYFGIYHKLFEKEQHPWKTYWEHGFCAEGLNNRNYFWKKMKLL